MYNNKFYIKRGGSGYKITAIDGIYYGEEIFLNNSLYFTPNRFTLSYYPDYKGWASWYEYYPDNYIFNRTDIWKTNGSFLSKLNDDTTVLIPDNNGPVDTTIEPIFNNAEPVRLLSTQWKSKAIDLTGGEDPLTTFDSIQAYDSYQISKQSTLSNTNNTRNLEGYWSCNDFRDYAVSNTAQMVDTSVWYRPFNTLNIAANKHWTKLKKLVDFWFGVRFKYAPYTITPLVLTGTKRLTVPYYSADFNPTIVTMTITPDIAISVGSILQIVVNGSTVYAKVLSGSAPDWTVKLYGNMSITGTNNTITSASLITKRHKLHLLDITKLVIKNIR